MRRTLNLVAMAVVAMMASYAMAQPEAEGQDGGPPPAEQPRPPRLDGPIPEQALAQLNLTDEQKKQIEEIRTSNKAAMEAWMKENGEKLKATMDKIRAAEKSGETDGIKELRDQVKTLYDSRRDLTVACHKKIEGVLTDEQKTKMRQGRTRGGQDNAARGTRRAQEGQGERKQGGGEQGGKGGAGEGRQGMQRGPGAPGMMGPMGVANLTEEQRQKIRAIMEEAQKKIHDEVLTDEQRKSIENMKSRFNGGQGGQGATSRPSRMRRGNEGGDQGGQQPSHERPQREHRRGGEKPPAPAGNPEPAPNE